MPKTKSKKVTEKESLKLQFKATGFESTLDLASNELEVHLTNGKCIVIKKDKIEVWSPDTLEGTIVL